MEYSFDVEHAKKYGLREAVILKNLMYWIVKNKANDKHNHDGRTWTYNSIKAFETLFPFLTGKQIRTALDNLVASGVVIKGNYNATAYDRTCWFALAENPLAVGPQLIDAIRRNRDKIRNEP